MKAIVVINIGLWYSFKYGAKQAFGQKMYIDPERGAELTDRYLNQLNK